MALIVCGGRRINGATTTTTTTKNKVHVFLFTERISGTENDKWGKRKRCVTASAIRGQTY